MTVPRFKPRRLTRARASLLTAAVLAMLLMTALVSGCSDDPPPETTMSALGAEIGDAKMDDVDLTGLLPVYTTPEYSANTQAGQAGYQLYLAAKAADQAFNSGEESPVTVTQDVGGDGATLVFSVGAAGGLFSVADISTITVSLERTDAEPQPWQIASIVLAR